MLVRQVQEARVEEAAHILVVRVDEHLLTLTSAVRERTGWRRSKAYDQSAAGKAERRLRRIHELVVVLDEVAA